MKSDSFVKVKRAFIKSYSTDNLNKANLLLDPREYGSMRSYMFIKKITTMLHQNILIKKREY